MPSYHEMANEKSYIFEDESLACFDFGNVLNVSADNSLLDQICIIIHNIRKSISIIFTWNYSYSMLSRGCAHMNGLRTGLMRTWIWLMIIKCCYIAYWSLSFHYFYADKQYNIDRSNVLKLLSNFIFKVIGHFRVSKLWLSKRC